MKCVSCGHEHEVSDVDPFPWLCCKVCDCYEFVGEER